MFSVVSVHKGGSHVIITNDALDLAIQGTLSGHGTSLYRGPPGPGLPGHEASLYRDPLSAHPHPHCPVSDMGAILETYSNLFT